MRQAAGELRVRWPAHADAPRGHSIQVRVYAEDPAETFQPSAGMLTDVVFPQDARVETWVERGTRGDALLRSAARQDHRPRRDREPRPSPSCGRRWPNAALDGIETNLGYLRQMRRRPAVRRGRHHHALPAHLRPIARARIEVIDARHPDHRAGLSRPPRLLGRRRAAVGSDGPAGLPAGQPPAWATPKARPGSK